MSTTASSHWDRHAVMALRGAIGGVISGLVFGAFQMWFVADAGLPASTIIHMIATIVQPDAYFAAGQTSAAVGWSVHVALSLTYGTLLGLLAAELRSNVTRVSVAALFGLAIFMFNFLVLAPHFYPVFDGVNQPFEAVVHVVFGAMIAPFIVRWSGRRTDDVHLPAVVEQARRNAYLGEQPVRTWDPSLMR